MAGRWTDVKKAEGFLAAVVDPVAVPRAAGHTGHPFDLIQLIRWMDGHTTENEPDNAAESRPKMAEKRREMSASNEHRT